jgi:hypothetical protein
MFYDFGRLRFAPAAALFVAALFVAASIGGCGGGSGDDTGLVGSYRVAEVGTAAGTQSCPAEVDLGNGVTTSCSGTDIFVLRKSGDFHAVTGDLEGDAPDALDGTWSSTSDEQTITIEIETNRRDENGDGRIDPEEESTFDPPLVMTGLVRERTDNRLVVDISLPSPFGGETLNYRAVLIRS